MAPHQTVARITVHSDQRIERPDQDRAGARLAEVLDGTTVMTTANDAGTHVTWTAAAPAAPEALGGAIANAAIAARHTLPVPARVVSLELTTPAELERRALEQAGADYFVPAEDAPPPVIPDVVDVAGFAHILGVLPSRIRQLRANPPKGFPEELPGLRGYWLQEDARAYAAIPRDRSRGGRPRTGDRTDR